ncbi:metallophosphoesterase family protein [Desertivirga xinjiangensis]|uniref:metallophosphoesterase family protein n=1 Tax=Desertivirga xinjiangensis TaxID=539206 RepID=UPI00210CD803|nr:metallophosphoesterase [Pedobacter xinjiangensis]
MKSHTSFFLTFLSLVSFGLYAQHSPHGDIKYPFRAAPVIKCAGESFEILYVNPGPNKIDSAIIKGPYWKKKLKIEDVEKGKFEFDPYTRLSVNNKIKVSVPKDCPEELYDLYVFVGGNATVSKRSVKVLKSYRSAYQFIHVSDLHVSRNWKGSAGDGYAEELELLDKFVDVANIIAPEYVISTGDNIHDYTRFNADSLGWGGTNIKDADAKPGLEEKMRNYFEGAKGFRGVQSINAPVFSVPGNHDFYGVSEDDYAQKSLQWNTYCGLRFYAFNYLDTHLMFVDDFLGDPVTDIPDSRPMTGNQGRYFEEFLKGTKGGLRIMAQHRHNRFDTTFLDKNKIDLVLNGHSHSPKVFRVGKTPTLSIRSGTVARSGEIKSWEKTLGFFRVFTIDKGKLSYSEPLRFCTNPTADYKGIISNLSMVYSVSNSGEASSNAVLISNKLPADLPFCKVRFVMRKGKYAVKEGSIIQSVDTDKFTIVDVSVQVGRKSEKTVKILPASS